MDKWKNFKRQVKRNLNKLNLEKLRRFKGLLKRSSIALFLLIGILFLKKINLDSTNYLISLVEENIRAEVDFIKGYNFLIDNGEKLFLSSEKALKVFNPFKSEKYSPPISASIYRPYRKGENQGVDLLSLDGQDPKSIIDGEVIKVELVDKKGYFVTMKKENLHMIYGYLEEPYIKNGDIVSKGEAVGSLGSNKDGKKYLRIEMKIDGELVNPSNYIDLK